MPERIAIRRGTPSRTSAKRLLGRALNGLVARYAGSLLANDVQAANA